MGSIDGSSIEEREALGGDIEKPCICEGAGELLDDYGRPYILLIKEFVEDAGGCIISRGVSPFDAAFLCLALLKRRDVRELVAKLMLLEEERGKETA